MRKPDNAVNPKFSLYKIEFPGCFLHELINMMFALELAYIE